MLQQMTPAVEDAVRTLLLLALLVSLPLHASVLPEEPPEGLRITVSISCDFEQRWWEATLYPNSNLPLEVRWRAPTMRGSQPRELVRDLTPELRATLYNLSRKAFDHFRLDRMPPLLGDPEAGPWLGSRTLSLSALILDGGLGRVDRIDLAIDLLPGRALFEDARNLVAGLAGLANPVDPNLDCR